VEETAQHPKGHKKRPQKTGREKKNLGADVGFGPPVNKKKKKNKPPPPRKGLS